jgi:hypothetical protein
MRRDAKSCTRFLKPWMPGSCAARQGLGFHVVPADGEDDAFMREHSLKRG